MLEMLLCLLNLPELLISTKWEVDVCAPFCLAAILLCKAVLDTLSIIIMRIIFARVIRNIQLLHLSEGKGKLEREFFRVNYLSHGGWTSSMAQKIKKLSESPATFPMAAILCMNDRLRTESFRNGEIGPKRDLFINF